MKKKRGESSSSQTNCNVWITEAFSGHVNSFIHRIEDRKRATAAALLRDVFYPDALRPLCPAAMTRTQLPRARASVLLINKATGTPHQRATEQLLLRQLSGF